MAHQELSDAELDHLADFLAGAGEDAMSLEGLDGYFAGLIAGPEPVRPQEVIPAVWGADFVFEDEAEAEDITALLLRHWETITIALRRAVEEDGAYWPLVFEDEGGIVRGNDWALGFMEAVDRYEDGWEALFDDDQASVAMAPILMLAHEYDPDPEQRSEPIQDHQRGELIEWVAASLTDIFVYFAASRLPPVVQVRREGGKVGRNDVCPCGSGKKFKRCCGEGNPTLQ